MTHKIIADIDIILGDVTNNKLYGMNLFDLFNKK